MCAVSLADRAVVVLSTAALSISFLVYVMSSAVPQFNFNISGWFPVQAGQQPLWKNLAVYARRHPSCWRYWVWRPKLVYTAGHGSWIGSQPGLRAYTARAKDNVENSILLKHVLRNI